MLWGLSLLLTYCLNLSNADVYDSYYGTPITEERINELKASGAYDTCTNDIESCTEIKGRRLDGSCNIIEKPTLGAFHTYPVRMVASVFGENFGPRDSKDGSPLCNTRHMRKQVFKDGKGMSTKFCQLMYYWAEASVNDYVSPHDTENFALNTNCCDKEGGTNYMCSPNVIFRNDSVHRYSGETCMNQTIPEFFQNQGCIPNNTTPDRLDYSTTMLDLSHVYFFTFNVVPKIRKYTGGLLKTETVNGLEFPSDGNSSCTMEMAIKTGCTRSVPNLLFGHNMLTIFFWRQHNQIARELAILNPCWDDERLFINAWEINIAIYCHITYYEFWPAILGRDIMIEKGIISDDPGYRDLYDPTVEPRIIIEQAYAGRWFHMTQQGIQHMHTPNGTRVGEKFISDYSLHQEKMGIDNDFVLLTHGALLQPGGKTYEATVDPDLGDRCLGAIQRTVDLFTHDIEKGRLFGIGSYMDYVNFCTGNTHETFEDLEYRFSKENFRILKENVKYPEDIEFLIGAGLENHIEGGYAPEVIACVNLYYLKQNLLYDKDWYERGTRYNPNTLEQLTEIRKATLAGLLCAVGDEISEIQSNAFLLTCSENPRVSCDDIPYLDLSAWKDDSCDC